MSLESYMTTNWTIILQKKYFEFNWFYGVVKMGCILEFDEPQIRYELRCQGKRQLMLIDILLKYAQIDLAGLASLLNVSLTTLKNVYNNKFLEGQSATDLLRLFLIFISD